VSSKLDASVKPQCNHTSHKNIAQNRHETSDLFMLILGFQLATV